MEYTIKKLGRLSGITTRTLRYYDEIDLLKPLRINSSGYRIYGETEVDRLQQILFYRELGVGLEKIKEILSEPSFESMNALREHRVELLKKRDQLNIFILNVEKTISMKEGKIEMSDEEKFEGFKQKMIEENEINYGTEIRAKYGDEQVNQSNQKVKNMTAEQYAEVESLSAEVLDTLKEAVKTNDPSGVLAQKTADLHRKWLSYFWDHYSKEAHAGLAQMYVCDKRFSSYYDKVIPGAAKFLKDSIFIYTGKNISN